jgi:hypothetical protein
MPIVAIEPGWGAIFCCDSAGCGDICDPWCENADPAEQERFVQSQHLGHVQFEVTGDSVFAYRCDDERCCGDDDDDDY